MGAFGRILRLLGALSDFGRGVREAMRPVAVLSAPDAADHWQRFQDLRARLALMPEARIHRMMHLLLARAIISAKVGNVALLRSLPLLAPTRALAVWACQEGARYDPEFRKLIARADAARDAARWQVGVEAYAAALRLYDCHAGYRVQLGHCYKEAGDRVLAEIAYRDGLALGAPVEDVWMHLEATVARNGGSRQLYPAAITRVLAGPAATRADLATSNELRQLAWLLHDEEEPKPTWLLSMMRIAPERDQLAARLIADPAFLAGNRALVALAGRRGGW